MKERLAERGARDILRALVLKAVDFSSRINFPFTVEEVARYYLPSLQVGPEELREFLRHEGPQARLRFYKGFLVKLDEEGIVEARLKGAGLWRRRLVVAEAVSNQIAKAARFVKCVAVTGSVAYGEWRSDDIDLFIIAERDALWIVLLMALVLLRIRKLLRLDKGQNFCLSYVHDEAGFASESLKNRDPLFARELIVARPLHGRGYYRRLLTGNEWVRQLYPLGYEEALRACANEGPQVRLNPPFPLRLLNRFLFVALSIYLRLKAYAKNLRLARAGLAKRAFVPILTLGSCVYASKFYLWLKAFWGDLPQPSY